MAASTGTGRPRLIFINRFYRPDNSATSQMLTDLAEALAAEHWDVQILCSRQRYDQPDAQLPTHEVLAGVRIRRMGGTRFGRRRLALRALDYLSFYLAATWQVWRTCRRGDVLIAKTDPPLISVPVHWVACLRGARLVNWLQDLFPEVAQQLGAVRFPRLLEQWLRDLRNRSLRDARCNVVLGERMRAMVLAQGVLAQRISIIENWSDAQGIRPMDARHSALRAELGLADQCVVGYSGNLGRAHDYRTLLGAMCRLRTRSDLVFVLIGGGSGMEMLRGEVERQGLTNVRFLPPRPRAALADALAAIDIHVATLLPELEGLIVPSKFYGILAAGRPTIFIGDPEGELGRIVRDERLGAVIGCGEEAALAEAIDTLAADLPQRSACGERARRLFEQRYTLQRALVQWRAAIALAGTP